MFEKLQKIFEKADAAAFELAAGNNAKDAGLWFWFILFCWWAPIAGIILAVTISLGYFLLLFFGWWILLMPSAWLYWYLYQSGAFSMEEHDAKDDDDENTI